MKLRAEDAMWCVIMFDLPVVTKKERKEATKFRKMLVDFGFAMVQFSVYGKFSPSVSSNQKIERFIKAHLPAHGEVRIFHLTDNQWASATRYIAAEKVENESAPDQLAIF